jgi:hypothetical protein
VTDISLSMRDHDDAVRAHGDLIDWHRRVGREHDALWLTDRLTRYGEAATYPSAFALQHLPSDLLNADTLYVDHAMMDLVQTAMGDFDLSEPMTGADVWIPHALMFMPEPFRALDINEQLVSWRAIQWCYTDQVGLDADTRETIDGVRFVIYGHIGDEDSFWNLGNRAERADAHRRGHRWGITHATSIPMRLMPDQKAMIGEGDPSGDWMRFWRVMLRLSGERIVAYGPLRAGRAAMREANRRGRPLHVPYVVRLRQPVQHRFDVAGGEHGSANYSHRFVVRGHWRNQWYPSEGRHRQRFIGAYIKGPEDLPLVIRNRVWNWDR